MNLRDKTTKTAKVLFSPQLKVTLLDNPYRSDFPIFSKHPNLAYLDNAATTQRPRQVIETITKFYEEENSNIHRGIYDLSNQATSRYEEVRKKVAHFLGSENPNTIGFTKGTTESINIIARSYIQPDLKAEDNIVTTIMEHHANFLPWQIICDESDAELRVLGIDEAGDFSLEELDSKLDNNTKILALNHISNTLGTVNQIKEIIDLAHAKGIPVLIDAAQSAAYYELNSSELKYDFLTFSAHKLFGPFGIGILYVNEKYINQIKPFNYGGGMIQQVSVDGSSFAPFPKNLEAGTPNIEGVLGLGAAIDYVSKFDRPKVQNLLLELTTYAIEKLSTIPQVRVIGSPARRSGIVSFTVEDIHPHDVASFLNKDGIAVRAGMHCTQPLMHHLDVTATVRTSFSVYNTKEEIDRLCTSLVELIAFWS